MPCFPQCEGATPRFLEGGGGVPDPQETQHGMQDSGENNRTTVSSLIPVPFPGSLGGNASDLHPFPPLCWTSSAQARWLYAGARADHAVPPATHCQAQHCLSLLACLLEYSLASRVRIAIYTHCHHTLLPSRTRTRSAAARPPSAQGLLLAAMDPGTTLAVLTAVVQLCCVVHTLAKKARAFTGECLRLASLAMKVKAVLQGIRPAVEASSAAAPVIEQALQVGSTGCNGA